MICVPPKEVQGCGDTLRSLALMPRITVCRIIAAIPVMYPFAAAVHQCQQKGSYNLGRFQPKAIPVSGIETFGPCCGGGKIGVLFG